MNTYIIESNDYIVINTKIKEIIKKHKLTNDMIVKYDLFETSISRVVEELNTVSFIYPNKVVICENAYFLSTSKPRGVVEHNVNTLINYLENPNTDNVLIFITDKIDTRKEAVKLIDKEFIVKGDVSIDDLVLERLDSFKMDNKTIKYLIDYCDNNNERILNEIDKLKCLKLDEKIITIEDINSCVIKLTGENIFSLIDAIVTKNKRKAFLITEELIDNGEEISKIIIMVADQFRLMLQVKNFLKKRYSQEEIAKMLRIHPYRVKLAAEKGYNYSEKVLLSNLEYFFDLDYMIKSGSSNPKLCFDLFLANL